MSRPSGPAVVYEEFADRRTLAKVAVGFVVAGLLVYFLAVLVGLEAVGRALRNADARWLALACVSTT